MLNKIWIYLFVIYVLIISIINIDNLTLAIYYFLIIYTFFSGILKNIIIRKYKLKSLHNKIYEIDGEFKYDSIILLFFLFFYGLQTTQTPNEIIILLVVILFCFIENIVYNKNKNIFYSNCIITKYGDVVKYTNIKKINKENKNKIVLYIKGYLGCLELKVDDEKYFIIEDFLNKEIPGYGYK